MSVPVEPALLPPLVVEVAKSKAVVDVAQDDCIAKVDTEFQEVIPDLGQVMNGPLTKSLKLPFCMPCFCNLPTRDVCRKFPIS